MTDLLKELDAVAALQVARILAMGVNIPPARRAAESAALRFVVTRHAEIAEAVKDARRFRWLLANAQTIEGRQDWYWWADDADVTPLTERIDAAIDAMHNSAREDGE